MGDVKHRLLLLTAGLCLCIVGCSRDVGTESATDLRKQIAFDAVLARLPLRIASPDLENNKPIPKNFTYEGGNKKPRFSVGGYPESTVTFVMIMEDPNAPGDSPYVHWVLYDIPVKEMNGTALPTPHSVVGKNSVDTTDYYGPRPPQDNKPHRYHFQFFAVNKALALKPGASRDQVVDALRTSALAKGELVATYQAP